MTLIMHTFFRRCKHHWNLKWYLEINLHFLLDFFLYMSHSLWLQAPCKDQTTYPLLKVLCTLKRRTKSPALMDTSCPEPLCHTVLSVFFCAESMFLLASGNISLSTVRRSMMLWISPNWATLDTTSLSAVHQIEGSIFGQLLTDVWIPKSTGSRKLSESSWCSPVTLETLRYHTV